MGRRDHRRRKHSEKRRLLALQSSSPSTIDAPRPYWREVEVSDVAGSASEKMDVSVLEKSLEATALEGTRGIVKVPPSPPIWAVQLRDWGMVFYIRSDHDHHFHTYPRVGGGPFPSLQDAQNAIDRFLHHRQDPTMFMPGLSHVEMSVKRTLYWPDGTRKTPSKSHQVDMMRNWPHQLAQALLDQYNEDHGFTEDDAYEVKEVVGSETICEGDVFKWYKHINFTIKAKGVDHGITNLCFAEVICSKKGELEELVPSCLQMLEPSDNGICHGCHHNNGSREYMKHPSDASAYTGGHVRGAFFAFGGPELPPMAYPVGDEDELHRAEEARLRAMFTDYEDAHVFDQYKGPYPDRQPLVINDEIRQLFLALGASS